jgi:hypothetical protein
MAAIRHGRVMAIVAEIVIGLYIVFFCVDRLSLNPRMAA